VIDFNRDNGMWGILAFVSAVVLMLDEMLGSGFVEAVRSERFVTTPGTVTKSEIGRGGRGTVRFNVEYTYTVNGQQYTGTKYHVQPQLVGNRYWFAARDANPVGAPVTVHFDPDEPAAAYLVPGLRPDVLFILWVLAPFNLFAGWFAWAGWAHLTGRRAFDPALRRCVRAVPDGWRARPDPATRFLPSASAILLLLTFCGAFVVGTYVTIWDDQAPWALPLVMWAGALTAAVVVAARTSRRALLHINELEGALTFRHAGARATVTRENVRDLTLITEIRKEKSGTSEVRVVTLRWRDKFAREQQTVLAEYQNADDALALIAWLTVQLDLLTAEQVAV
jgi:hypothetical protein